MTMGDLPSGVSAGDDSDSAMPSMGALVIRTWTEPDQAPGFRARLTFSLAPDDEPGTISTADPNEVLSLVRQWLIAQSGASREA